MLFWLIWSKGGLLVPLFVVLGFVAGSIVGGFSNAGAGLGVVAAAACIWMAGKRLNDKPDRQLVEPDTGEVVVLRGNAHTFFFVPMQWWAPVAAVLGLLVTFLPSTARPERLRALPPRLRDGGAPAGSMPRRGRRDEAFGFRRYGSCRV